MVLTTSRRVHFPRVCKRSCRDSLNELGVLPSMARLADLERMCGVWGLGRIVKVAHFPGINGTAKMKVEAAGILLIWIPILRSHHRLEVETIGGRNFDFEG